MVAFLVNHVFQLVCLFVCLLAVVARPFFFLSPPGRSQMFCYWLMSLAHECISDICVYRLQDFKRPDAKKDFQPKATIDEALFS